MNGRAARIIWAVWGVLAVVATVLTFADTGGPLRPAVTWTFLALGPGWAFLGGLRAPRGGEQGQAAPAIDPLTRVTAALGLSIAINILVAEGMVLAHAWSPRTGLLAVLAVSAVGLTIHAYRALRRRRTRRLIDGLRAQLSPPAGISPDGTSR